MILIKKVVLLGLFLLLIVNLASAQYYYEQGFGFGLSGLGGLDDILLIYELYSGWFDFFIFFIIFLGLTQVVFGQGSHFEKQVKPLSIGISLALSIGLVSWERYNGISLLTFGPVAFLIFIMLLGFTVFSILKKTGQTSWVAGAWAYVLIFATLMIFGEPLRNQIEYFGGLFQLLNLLFWVCIIIGLIGFFFGSQQRPQQRGNP